MQEEIWKDIKGYEGIYQVSNLGQVRSLDRKVYNHFQKGKILKTHNNGHSYYNLCLYGNNKKQKHAYIHILVANAFIPNPNNYKEVNHKDFNKSNNCVSNLEWVSREQNFNHFRKSKYYLQVKDKKQKKFQSKTIERIFRYKNKIIEDYKNGNSIKKIAELNNVGKDFVSDVIELFREFL